MKDLIFFSTLFVNILLVGSLVLSLLKPSYRVWPPPGKKSWQFLFTWVLFAISILGILVIGIMDWDSFIFRTRVRYPFGGILILAGGGISFWGVKILGIYTSQGLGGEFITEGPYRYTRNPQYVGDITMIIGYIILSNSTLTFIVGLCGILWFVLAPFTEEPWLQKQYGLVYDEYMIRIPRFVSIKRRKINS
ncbi:MAG: methyltransferase family protein [Planctomycetota bacterium]|jgi:protein-S-isoprenylcysteine O-methyltransferase Ste14